MRKGVTLTEVIVGTIILAIAFGGLLATFVGVRRYVRRANRRLIAADLVSQTMGDLYRAVREDTWNTGALQAGAVNLGAYTIDNQLYQDLAAPTPNSYTVVNEAAGDFRRVTVIIHYD